MLLKAYIKNIFKPGILPEDLELTCSILLLATYIEQDGSFYMQQNH